jgi:starch synthase (maltosyl-transferring)
VERRRRVIIEGVKPEIDCGRFPIKRAEGEPVVVEADVYADGHDAVSCILLDRRDPAGPWRETPMKPLVNDRWRAEFTVGGIGRHYYTILGWVDAFKTWRRDFIKRINAGQDVAVDLLVGAELIDEAAARAHGENAQHLADWAARLRADTPQQQRSQLALDEELAAIANRYPDRRLATQYHRELAVSIDRTRARFSTWYELFPRSCSPEPQRHGTFRDVEQRLPYVASMGFDVLYLPPIHPVGRNFRKGPNNAVIAEPGDVGSPWAIGADEGGHKAIHPELGTFEDFEHLRAKAEEHGIELALDIAFQCSPDHPYVKDHPDWFRRRPDGTIQYAENPPKKYQDIYPIEFESEDWQALWQELKSVIDFWIEKGIRIFRVDNPHTKAFPFWEWAIGDIKQRHPETIFLSEAFTRPKVMYQLAKAGFTQSYTYFTWRNTKSEITEYFTELTQTEVREFFRPNLWPNTPDILPEYLQFGGRPAFITRLILAATLGASYGMYGPAYELCDNTPRQPGSEEYLNSEKYEIKNWNLNDPWSLRDIVARVNRIRKENEALHSDWGLRFHQTSNEKIICYSKVTRDLSNIIVVVANLDFNYTHAGWVTLDLDSLGLEAEHPFQVHELIGESRHLWNGARNYVELDPKVLPAHILRIRRKLRTERDFDYFL